VRPLSANRVRSLNRTYDGKDMNHLLIGSAAPKFCLHEA